MASLTNLGAKWITPFYVSSEYPFYVGIRFNCPHCGKRIVVGFYPPINAIDNQFLRDYPRLPSMEWDRVSGDTMETLTLSPSVDVAGHWHGHIVNGELTNHSHEGGKE